MNSGHYLRHIAREFRGAGGRLIYFVACLAVGVAAVSGVAGLSRSLDRGFRSGAKELLGGDLSVRNREPLPEGLSQELNAIEGTVRTDLRDQPLPVANRQGDSVIAELKVVDGPYPFYGSLETDPPRPLSDLLTPTTTVVAPEILSKLGLKIGDPVLIGGEEFEIAGIARAEPDRITGFMYIGPRAYVSKEAIARTSVNETGIRVRYQALLKFPEDTTPDELEALGETLEEKWDTDDSRIRIETYTEGRPSLRRGLARLEQFLSLVALLSLLLGGVGVAQAVRAWIEGRLDSIAILKCAGMRPSEVFYLYLWQSLALGLAGSIVGVVMAALLLWLGPPFFREHIPADLIDPWQPLAYIRGLALGLCITLIFSVPPLLAILRVPPARVFRREAEPLPEARWVPWATAGAVIIGIGLMAALLSSSARIGVLFTLGVLATGAALAFGAWLLTKTISFTPRDLGQVWLRHGLAAVARPGASTLASIVGLGLGMLVLFCTASVQRHLNDQLESELPRNAPSAFLLDVRPDQWNGINEILRKHGAEEVQMAPLIFARFTSIDGVDVAERDADYDRDWHGREIQRQQRITSFEELPADNEIIEGELWSDPNAFELSIEEDFARRQRLDVGSTATIQAWGKTVEARVTSIREIDWESLNLNFEIVIEPGVLDDVPQLRLATARFPLDQGQAIQDEVVSEFPNVTFVQVAQVVERVTLQLSRIGWGIRILGLFIIGAGIAVLTGTIGVESQRRGREVALLKTIGMTRRQVAAFFATEYALIGFVAALIGVSGGGILAWLAITRVLEIEWTFHAGLFSAALAAGVLVAVFAGVAASIPALRKRPIDVLRTEQ